MSASRESSQTQAEESAHSTDPAYRNISNDTPFPYKQLSVLAICRIAEPIAFVSITAYSFVMVQHIKGEKNASFYSGLLVSAFALAEACTAFFWGQLSDRYGRKPIILVALAGTALSSLLFGLATNYWVALLARVVGGLLNGNVAVMQTMVAEIVTDPKHEPKAYAMQPFMWSLGSFAGSALGGFTAEPAQSYPGVFSKDGIFGKFPYLLPNLISVVVIVLAMIQAYFLLEETNIAVIEQHKPAPVQIQDEVIDETTPLRPAITNTSITAPRLRRLSAASYIATKSPIPNEPSFDLRRPSIVSIVSSTAVASKMPVITDEFISEESSSETSPVSAPVNAFNKDVVIWTIALVILCYHQMGFGALIPIYLLDNPQPPPQHFHFYGGLGLTLPQVGGYLAVNSIISLFIQGFIFPVYVSKLGVWRSVVSLTIFCPFVHLAVPLVTLLPKPGIGIYIAMALQGLTTLIVYPCLLILLKNAAESPQVLGKINGLAMSLCSGARTVSPPVVGIVYSTLGSAAAWWSCAIVGFLAAIQLCFIRRPKENDEAILRRASVATDGV